MNCINPTLFWKRSFQKWSSFQIYSFIFNTCEVSHLHQMKSSLVIGLVLLSQNVRPHPPQRTRPVSANPSNGVFLQSANKSTFGTRFAKDSRHKFSAQQQSKCNNVNLNIINDKETCAEAWLTLTHLSQCVTNFSAGQYTLPMSKLFYQGFFPFCTPRKHQITKVF